MIKPSYALILVLLMASHFEAAAQLSTPHIGYRLGADMAVTTTSQSGRRSCAAGFSPDQAWSRTTSIVTAANGGFTRRGWADGFLSERLTLALKYRSRSRYFDLTKSGEIVSTLGYSWAEYTANFTPNPNRIAVDQSPHQILPGEDSLHAKPFPRPVDSKGKGIIFELRTWFIRKDGLSASERKIAFTSLIAETIESTFKRLRKYPELYEKPIMYLYGDEASLKLYSMMGFEKISDKAIEHSGTQWWIMAISPKNLERLLLKMSDLRYWADLNQELEISIPHGNFTLAAGGRYANHSGHYLSGLARDHEINPDITVAAGGSVAWDANGRLSSVSTIANEVKLGPEITVAPGGSISWFDNGDLLTVYNVARDVEVAPGIVVAKGGNFAFNANRDLLIVSGLKYETEVYPGMWAKAGSSVQWQDPGVPYIVSEISRPFRLPNGKIAPIGSEIRFDPSEMGYTDEPFERPVRTP